MVAAAASSSKKRLTPNQQARRTRILDAARQLVASDGYDGMIMRDVAELASVSPTTLYNLYNTKDELLLAALRDSVAESWSRSSAEVPELGFQRLMVQLHNSVEQTRESPAYARAITQALLRAGGDDQITRVLLYRNRDALELSLTAMQADGSLDPATDTTELATTLVGCFWANYMLWSKCVFDEDALEAALKRDFQRQLLPVTRGALRQTLERDC